MDFPCKTCITVSICKAMMKDEKYIFNDLMNKCTLFREYIHEPIPVSDLRTKLDNVENFYK